ncbi:hypothetical protein PUN28_015397 [Cardiocondyla obscurior]|uniref:Uncharacterized protein n=1 Tax=Cardiocondyla obscurior TaxID=286306 RepID=A0AAW2EWP3_9HYME
MQLSVDLDIAKNIRKGACNKPPLGKIYVFSHRKLLLPLLLVQMQMSRSDRDSSQTKKKSVRLIKTLLRLG